jgi:hypothetical protein
MATRFKPEPKEAEYKYGLTAKQLDILGYIGDAT